MNKTVIVLMLYVLSNYCSRQVVFPFFWVLFRFGLCSLYAIPLSLSVSFSLFYAFWWRLLENTRTNAQNYFILLLAKPEKKNLCYPYTIPYIFSHTFNRKTCAFCNIIMICSLSTRQQKRKENDRERQRKNHEVWYWR